MNSYNGRLADVGESSTTREKASSSAGFRCISSAGIGATNKALQLTDSSSARRRRYCYTSVAAALLAEARY